MNLKLKRAVSEIIVFLMILSPVKNAAAAEMILTEQQTQQPTIAASEAQPVAPSQLPSGSLFASDSPLSAAGAVFSSENLDQNQPVPDEEKEFIGNDPVPFDMPLTQTKEQAVAQASQDLANRFTTLTQAEKDKLLNNNIKLVSAVVETWTDGCVGWELPGGACTQAVITGYKIVFKLHDIQYEYHNGALDPAKQVAILAMNAFMQNTGAPLSELAITSSAIQTQTDSKGNETPNQMGLFDVVIASKKNGSQKYTVDYYNQTVIAAYVLDNGNTFNHNITGASGYIKDGSVTSYYADVTVLSVTLPAPETFTKPAGGLSDEVTVLNLIGTYKAGEETFAVYGQIENEVYDLGDGKNLTYNPADKTGILRSGNLTEHYQDIRVMGVEGCNAQGLCWSADFALAEGHSSIGFFSKQTGEFNIRYVITGQKVSSEITMTDGRTFHYDVASNTGWVLEDGVRADYNKILFQETGRMECMSNNPDSGAPCVFSIVNRILASGIVSFDVRIGSYEVKMGNTVIYYDIYGEPPVAKLLMTNGQTFNFNIAEKTGWIQDGSVTKHYKNVLIPSNIQWLAPVSVPVGGPFSPLPELNNPLPLIGSYQKYGETFDIYGELEKEVYQMEDGRMLTVLPDKTGFLKNGPLQENFSDIIFFASMTCTGVDPNNTICAAAMPSRDLLDSHDQIGRYVQKIGDKTIQYAIYAKRTSTEITMVDGRKFTYDPAAHTGWLQEGNVKDHFEDVNLTLSQKTICPSSNPEIGAPCQVLAALVDLAEGYVVIGSYQVVEGNTTSLFLIHGKPDFREITLENGKVLTIDLQMPETPVVRSLAPVRSVPAAKASVFRGGSTSAFSSSFSKSEDSEEEKKKKKRKLRRVI